MKPASLLALALAAGVQAGAFAQAPRVVAGSNAPAGAPTLAGEVLLTPRQFAQLVAIRSPEVRYSRLAVDVAGALSNAESALYEAVLFGSLRGTDVSRQRTTEERLVSAATLPVLDERTRNLETGVRQRLPTAGEVSLSYRVQRRRANIIQQATAGFRDTEWTGALVLTYKQPLLRSFGRDIVETDRRVAELEQQVQWMQFRQQVLKSMADSLNLYWQMRRAEVALRLREEAVNNARRISTDVDARIQGGRAPAANLIEVNSNVVSRQTDFTRAQQAVREGEARMLTALAIPAGAAVRVRTAEAPLPAVAEPEPLDRVVGRALEQWPPYLVSRLRLEQGRLRLNFARNQKLPQLDLTASYTGNGYSNERGDVQRLVTNDRYPEWVVGVNFEMPIEGNGRATGQFDAQALRVQQSELELEAIRTSLSNDLAQRRDDLEAAMRLVNQLQDELKLRQQLVDSERERYNLGVGQLSQWLLRENDLLEARQRHAEAEMRVQQARVAWLFAQGGLLDEFDIALRSE